MRGHAERGFSMVEVVLALGLLAGVLISIGGLFIIGSRTVNSGRTASQALATGREIVEEMVGWGFTQLWGNFGLSGQDVSTYTVDCRTNTANGFCPGWQTTLRGELGTTAYSTIKIDSVTNAGGTTPVFVDSATGDVKARNVRLTVTVNWTEPSGRTRSVQVETTKN